MKSILRQLKFYLKQGLFGVFVIFMIALIITYAQSNTNIPLWITISVSVIILVIVTYLYFAIGWDFKKPFCKIPVTAKLVGDTTIYQRRDDVTTAVYHRSLFTLEYEYKNKIYKKTIVSDDSKPRKNNSDVDIMVCKVFPKIIYIVK